MAQAQALRPTRRRARLVGLVVAAIVALWLVGPYAERACRTPVDVSGTTRLPAWLAALKNQDALAYPAHVAVGTVLDGAGCAPEAAGLQWIKAGAHARSERDVRAAAAGLAASRGRSADAGAFDGALCGYVTGGYARPQQEATVALAGLSCPTAAGPGRAVPR